MIEYNRVFLKSGEGITPCILSGSNNCYETSFNGHMRRERSWSCFQNMIGVSEETILETVKTWMGGYQEHWMKNGKWVDDAGLIRWVKTGIRSAVSLESLLSANRMPYARFIVYTCTPEVYAKEILSAKCHTTAELDTWIREAKEVIQKRREAGRTAFPGLSGLPENLRKPRVNTPTTAIVKKRNRYLVSHTDCQTCWSQNITKAETILWEEAEGLLVQNAQLHGARLVDAARKSAPNNAVIRFKTGLYAGRYISGRSRSRIYLSGSSDGATRYADEKAANAAVKKLQPAVVKYGELEVKII